MSRAQIKEGIYSTLLARTDLLALLGPVSADQRRLYAGWPQTQPKLTGTEPDEGWMVIYEEQTVTPRELTYEDVYYDFHMFVTRLSLAEDCIDIIDDIWNWKIAGQNSLFYGERLVIYSRRIHLVEGWDEETHLYHKVARVLMRMVKTPFS
jgi:hypothetical protein